MNGTVLRKRILLLLYAGLALGFAQNPRRQYKIFQQLPKEWGNIKEQETVKEIKKLYRSKLVQLKKNQDGSLTAILTDKGKFRTLTYHFEDMKIKSMEWDGKWRMVSFDIPEKKKAARNALRSKLREVGFIEFQKSMFVFPYQCKDEVDFIIEFFNLRAYVRYGVFEFIDNDLHLRKYYGLS